MKILFVLLLALGCYANPTGSELKKTPTTAFDFTMVPSNDIKETLQDMIMVEIGKELFLERRKNNLWQCQTDQFGTAYCPTGLATARPYTAYYQSTTYERESAVMDYQTGFSVAGVGQVVDYANKIPSTNYIKATFHGSYTIPIYTDINSGKLQLSRLNADFSGYISASSFPGSIPIYTDINSGKLQLSRPNADFSGYISASSFPGSIPIYTDINSGKLQLSRPNADFSGYISPFYQSNLYSCPEGILEGNQCKQTIIKCPDGYIETTGAETSKGQCKRTVSYNFYQYTCPSTYTPINYGFTSYTKTDPNTSAENWNSLDDAVNSATPPTGNCSKSISYKYYEYLCQAKNSFLEPIKNLNSGLKSPCSKTDSDKTKDNTGTLDDACNSSTPPTNNCQSTEYTCNSALFKPVYVGGKWVCSPYLCNDDMKCGYGTCDLPTTPSATKYQDIAYNPLGTINDNRCNGDICDFVVNARVTYCESKQCPKGDDIIEKNGKCYKLECPAGTYLSGEKCIKVN